MLQEIPVYENGFENSNNGRSFDEFKEWLVRSCSMAMVGCPNDKGLSDNREWPENQDPSDNQDRSETWTLSDNRTLSDHRTLSKNIYWFMADGLPVGFGVISQVPSNLLRAVGGNIGYIIRPTQRGKGYGTLFLGLLVEEARKLNLDKLLLIIQNSNAASLRIALRNGGKLEPADQDKSLVWIDCS